MCLIENSQCLKSIFQFWGFSFVSAPLLAMLRVYSLFCTQAFLLAGFKGPSRVPGIESRLSPCKASTVFLAL